MKNKTSPFYDVNSVDKETHHLLQRELNKEPQIKNAQQKREHHETIYRRALDAYRLKNQQDAARIKTLSKKQCTFGDHIHSLPTTVKHWSLQCKLTPCSVMTKDGIKHDPAIIVPYSFCETAPVMSLYPLCYKFGGTIITAEEVQSVTESPFTLPMSIIEASMSSDEISMGSFAALQVSIHNQDHFVIPDHAIFAQFEHYEGNQVNPEYWSYLGNSPNLEEDTEHANILQARDNWPTSFQESQVSLIIANI